MTSTVSKRTQGQRSAATRELILSAAIKCLIDYGYAGTTTNAIQKHARVSRGALTHQFPIKQDLLIAAIAHLSQTREAEILGGVRRMQLGVDREREGLRLLWQTFSSDLFLAATELWLASRADDRLHEALYRAERELGRRHIAMLAQVFGPEVSMHPKFHEAVDMVMRLMRGTALTDILRGKHTDEATVVQECATVMDSLLNRLPTA